MQKNQFKIGNVYTTKNNIRHGYEHLFYAGQPYECVGIGDSFVEINSEKNSRERITKELHYDLFIPFPKQFTVKELGLKRKNGKLISK